jgi:hypothetical protein
MPEADPGLELSWAVLPAREAPLRGVLAAICVLVTGFLALAFGGTVMGILALLLVGGGIGPYYVRTRYRLTPEGVEVNSVFQRTHRPWSAFRRAYVGKDGVTLSPFQGRHILEPYRSVRLRFAGNGSEVLEWIRRHGPAPERRDQPTGGS